MSEQWRLMQVVMLPCVCPYTCVCMCVSWSPFPFTSVDRWHPLALWLACQRLNMLMGARLQASHSYINVNGTPRPILPTHTHTHLHHVASDSSGLIWLLPIRRANRGQRWDSLGHCQTITKCFKLSTGMRELAGRNDSYKMPQSRKVFMKAIQETSDPFISSFIF